MNIQKRHIGKTYVSSTYPWGLHPRCGHRLLCSDGKIRAAELAQTPDTFFSNPATIRVNGKVITGYMTVVEQSYDAPSKVTGPWLTAYQFRQHTNGQDSQGLPPWDSLSKEQLNAMIASVN